MIDIKGLKDKHKGERCFIGGTGSSIKNMDLSFLKDETVIGVNNFYYTGVACKYYCVEARVRYEENYRALEALDTMLCITGHAKGEYEQLIDQGLKIKEPVIFDWDYVEYKEGNHPDVLKLNCFSTDLSEQVYVFGMVITVALQLAYYMGFKEVYLIGCDCDYGKENIYFDERITVKTVVDEDYRNFWFKCYELCKRTFEKDNRRIFNATAGGGLEVFERVEYSSLFGSKE